MRSSSGAPAIGYTIYPGSDRQYEMFEEVRAGAAEAKANGLAVVVWAYPRGGTLDKDAETALDVIAYGAHIAALLGAHIIKVKPPTAHIAEPAAKTAYDNRSKLPRAAATHRACNAGGVRQPRDRHLLGRREPRR